MLLAIDIGNTQSSIGVFQGDNLLFDLCFKTDPSRTKDEHTVFLSHSFQSRLGGSPQFERAILCSVVPAVTSEFIEIIGSLYRCPFVSIGPGIKSGISLKVSDPSSVGADRVVNAVAAKHLFGAPALVIDFGTAISFDFVSRDGNYEGGIIAPGMSMSLDALVRNTAKLPRIDLIWPRSVIGKNTAQCMQSGAVLGYACMVDGLIEKVQQEVGPIDHVIATGSWGRLFAEHSEKIKSFEPHLTLRGLKIIADLNP